VFYCDADSVIFVQKKSDTTRVKSGDYLGDLTNELEEYEEFISVNPKTRRFRYSAPPLENVQQNVK
jgi:hypothetical protein